MVDRAPPPAWVTLEKITAEQVDLYSYVLPPGENIPVSVEPFPVDESVPTEDNIEWAVTQLHNHRSGGTSGMRAEHLKVWIAAARKKEREEAAAEQENPIEGRTMAGTDRAGGDNQREDSYGGFLLGEGSGACSDGVWRGESCGGFHVVGGGPDPPE